LAVERLAVERLAVERLRVVFFAPPRSSSRTRLRNASTSSREATPIVLSCDLTSV